ncbi:MAG: phosphatase PAP2 family protein [Bacteroidia bacterium]|nr:phosphatase PAP2 family protein [Bacteroidia bacterium]
MKKIHFLIFLLPLMMLSCQEQQLSIFSPELAQPATLDPNGGKWRTVTGVVPQSIEVVTPADSSSDFFKNEMLEIERLSLARTPEQIAQAEYWGSGSVLRWNQIARELVAKYNIPPEEGSIPNPAKPVASPPWAARAYAMLSVAQYDALVTTWHYKFHFNRAAPAVFNPSLSLLLPKNDLPSYPSEDAAIAEASFTILKALFPLEESYLKDLAQQHQFSRLVAGANLRSDLTAGANVGTRVANRVLTRAKTDRMSLASDPDDTWLNIAVPYEPWRSLEPTPTKPVLPLYGQVKTWFDSAAVFATIPAAPPLIGSAEFQADLNKVAAYTRSGVRDYWRMADFWADGSGTFTPIGHWNAIAEDYIREEQLNELRTARVLALLNRSAMDAGIACWHTKYKYFLPRPSQIDPTIKTAAGIPNFPAYTSGHSTFSMASATILAHLFPDHSQEIISMADEAGLSRVVSGIHYEFDNTEGKKCGRAVGNLAIEWALLDGAD